MGDKKKLKKVNDNKKNIELSKLILLIVICILFVILVIFSIKDFISNDQNIKSVKKILKTKYFYVDCIDSYCNGFVAIKGDKLKKSTIELYNEDGKKIASYKEKYNSNDKNVRTPYQLSNKYFIMKTINNKNSNVQKYSIVNKKGKELYTTNNVLSVLTENFVLMKDKKDRTFSILDINGKELYNNISNINSVNKKYVSFKIDDDYVILNEEGYKILDGYRISRVIKKDCGEVLYFIVEDIKSNIYYYYDINKLKIIGDGFIDYTYNNSSKELIITKRINDKNEKYILNKDGKQIKYNKDNDNEEIVSDIKKKIDTDLYYLYNVSVTKKGQKNILVDNKRDKSFGILNLDTNKYIEIYKYNLEKSSFNSSISKLNQNNNDLYLQISCTRDNCDIPKTIVYDFEHMTEIYNVNEDISDYVQYKNGYKVIKYPNTSSNVDYRAKYVLYDKNNKEVLKSSNRIALIDSELSFGNEYSYDLTLYSVKKNKVLNEESTKASMITIAGKKLYRYSDKDGNIIIYNSDGNKVISAKGDYLKYNSTSIVYLKEDKVVMYDVKNLKTRTYKLKKNEKLNDSKGNIIPLYRGTLFINNSTDKYVKIINSKGKVLKKIKNAEISSVKTNTKNNNIFIIVKENGKTGNLYGLYVAK